MSSLPVNFVWTLTLHNLLMAGVCWLTGFCVRRYYWRVNYTRKVCHFTLMIIPFLAAPLLPYEPSVFTLTSSLVVFVLVTLIFLPPIRHRFSMVDTAFASVDRPEDRPFTIRWIITQAIAAYLVLAGMFWILRAMGAAELIMIPILVNGLGDGLAEPIGVRFGKHAYRVPSLARGRRYTRSIEGSACVLVVGIITVLAFSGYMEGLQFPVILVTLPIGMTLAEACSPHAWDAPLLYLVGGGLTVLTLALF